jgi:hypothetical protein
MTVLATITDPEVVRKILDPLRVRSTPLPRAPARDPIWVQTERAGVLGRARVRSLREPACGRPCPALRAPATVWRLGTVHRMAREIERTGPPSANCRGKSDPALQGLLVMASRGAGGRGMAARAPSWRPYEVVLVPQVNSEQAGPFRLDISESVCNSVTPCVQK